MVCANFGDSEETKMKRIQSIILGLVLAASGTTALLAQSGAKSDIKSAGNDMKEAGKATGNAAKKTGKAVGKGTKKAANKAAEKTEAGAAKVKDSTKP